MHSTGKGVAQDYVEAVKWYRKAADQGEAIAQCFIGSAYNKGEGVAQDHFEAVKEAADQGEAIAQFYLGFAYQKGEGVEQDCAEAILWYRQAADQGEAGAQAILGEMSDLAQEYVQAHMWFNLAASSDIERVQKNSAKRRDDIAKKMTPAQIAEAQRLASAWKPRTQ